MHIGLIGGIGPAATVYYYERTVQAFAAAGEPLHLTIGHTSALELSRNVAAGRVDAQAREFVRITGQLAAAGADELAQVNDDYVAMAIAGAATPEQRARLLAAGQRLFREQGADALLLGGTDLNLVFADGVLDGAIVDSAAVHVDAIVDAALAGNTVAP